MNFARWYPTLVTLADGRQLVIGGRKFRNNSPAAATDNITIPPVPEIYDPQTERWSLLSGAADQSFYNRVWYYPRSWLRHDGNVIVADPQSDKLFQISVNGSGSLTELGEFRGSFGGVNSPAAMFAPGKILFVARNKRAEVLDISGDRITVERTTPSNLSRNWADATVLANGEVFLSGGIYTGAANNSGDYPGEIWNPDTGEWTLTAKAAKARLYHSTTMLLPNGRVLAAGGGPPGPVINMNAEVFMPPYLFDENGALAQRPAITQLGQVDYGIDFNANVSSETPISKVSFIRAGSVTHSFDQGQRYMELAYQQNGNLLTITAPDNANLAPPGLYMLFVFNRSGVPSQARLVMMGSNQSVTPPAATDPDPADSNPANLLSNGGFETNKSGWLDCSAEALSQINSQSNQGQGALLQQAGACLYQEISVSPGTTYTVSCDAFAQNSPYSSLNINMLDGAYNELAETTVDITATAYQRYSGNLEAPQGASMSAITLYSEGDTFFDSCVVTADGDTVDPVNPPAPPASPSNNLLANSTFDQGKDSWTDCAASQLTSVVADGTNNDNALKVENTGCIYQEFPVTAGKQYQLQCTAKSQDTRYTSVTLQISDRAYTPLDSAATVVAPGAYRNYTTTLNAPTTAAVGAVTLYSEDASHFDSCFVAEI